MKQSKRAGDYQVNSDEQYLIETYFKKQNEIPKTYIRKYFYN